MLVQPTQATYLDMLTYRRPAGSKSERRFINRFLLSLPGAVEDTWGNVHVQVGEGRGLFSAHTDTMHWKQGRQHVLVGRDGCVRLAPAEQAAKECLGADDASGVYVLLRMIAAGVEGRYVFHREEERGGKGSYALADAWSRAAEPPSFTFAVAFDRRGLGDVITHQSYGRCCSESFASELALRLGIGYLPCSRGIFTDTANYTDLVGECTNISIGYYNEHGPNERQDLAHLERIAAAACKLDWYSLPQERAAGEAGWDLSESKYTWTDLRDDSPSASNPYDTVMCSVCDGKGEHFFSGDECRACFGFGYVDTPSGNFAECEWCGCANMTQLRVCADCQTFLDENGLQDVLNEGDL